MSGWVVRGTREKERVKVVEKFVRLMGHLHDYNNFNGVLEVMSGLKRFPFSFFSSHLSFFNF